MIESLTIQHVGPLGDVTLRPGKRLTVITGDNGIGKTVVLDAAWYMLTSQWMQGQLVPNATEDESTPSISLQCRRESIFQTDEFMMRGFINSSHKVEHRLFDRSSRFNRVRWGWFTIEEEIVHDNQENNVVDFGVDDGAPAYLTSQKKELLIRQSHNASTSFSPPFFAKDLKNKKFGQPAQIIFHQHLFSGLHNDQIEFPGVYRGITMWWHSDPVALEKLNQVLAVLSPPDEPITLAEPAVPAPGKERVVFITAGPGHSFPITHASEGMTRALSIAYLLVWLIDSHREACRLTRQEPAKELVLMIDEVEQHLHPAWQRTFLPAILKAIELLAPEMAIQLICTTHSPMVLASLEPVFNPERDKIVTLEPDRENRCAVLREMPWWKRGTVGAWLTDPIFGLDGQGSRERTDAIRKAVDFIQAGATDEQRAKDVHDELSEHLGEDDPFWPHWLPYAARHGLDRA